MADVTKAGFLQDPSVKTPVFVRFSTVAGSRGSVSSVGSSCSAAYSLSGNGG